MERVKESYPSMTWEEYIELCGTDETKIYAHHILHAAIIWNMVPEWQKGEKDSVNNTT